VDGGIQPLDQGARAVIYADDPVRDLALLKLTRSPTDFPIPPPLALADPTTSGRIRPGLDCLAIGHPSGGTPWLLRVGLVDRVADWPRDAVEVVIRKLGAGASTDPEFAALAKQMDEKNRKIILTSCNLGPGDSGGPLLDTDGQVIGVAYAIANPDPNSLLAKLTYHIHVDELRRFAAQRPTEPLKAVPPSPPADWQLAGGKYKLDFLVPGLRSDTVVLSEPPGDRTTESPGAARSPDIAWFVDFRAVNKGIRPADISPTNPIAAGKWQYQFVLFKGPTPTAYYSTRGDQTIDAIVQAPAPGSDRDMPVPDVVWRRNGMQWRVEAPPAGRPLVSADWFADKAVGEQFEPYVNKVTYAFRQSPGEGFDPLSTK
jgi:hypothetical protein